MFSAIDEKVFGSTSPDDLKHAPASEPNTYLPRSGDGAIDSPNGEQHPASVYSLDKRLEELNEASVNYAPERVGGFCKTSCGRGCSDEAPDVPDPREAVEAVGAKIADLVDQISEFESWLAGFSDEQMAARQATVYRDQSGMHLAGLAEKTQAIYPALTEAVEDSRGVLRDSLAAIRVYAQAARNDLADRAEARAKPTDLLAFIPWAFTGPGIFVGAGIGSVMTLWDRFQLWRAGKAGADDADVALAAVEQACAENDQKVAALLEAIKAWTVRTHVSDAVHASVKPAKGANGADPLGETKGGVDAATATPAPALSPGGGGVGETEIKDADPMGTDLASDPLGTGLGADPFGGMGAPAGMGGANPFGGAGSPLGTGMGADPFGQTGAPLTPTEEDPFAEDEKEPLEEEGEDPFAEDEEDDTSDEGEEASDEAAADDETAAEDTESETDEVPVTMAATTDTEPAPAAVDPNSPEARTVTLPDGRQVEFPDARTAEMVRALVAADPSAPTSLYMAASDAGLRVNPMGQDIGQVVPPSELRPGDVVVSDAGTGVFIGNGEVLMESQEIKPLSEVSVFNGEHQGLFRLEQPDATMAAAAPSDAPAQPVGVEGDVSGAAAPVGTTDTTETAALGAPTDEPNTETEAGFDPMGSGVDNGTGPLFP